MATEKIPVSVPSLNTLLGWCIDNVNTLAAEGSAHERMTLHVKLTDRLEAIKTFYGSGKV